MGLDGFVRVPERERVTLGANDGSADAARDRVCLAGTGAGVADRERRGIVMGGIEGFNGLYRA